MLMWGKPDLMKSNKKKENQNRDQNETICCFLYHVAYSVDQIPDFIHGFSLFFSGRQSKWDFCYWLLAVLGFHHSFAWPEVTLAVRCYMVQIGKHGLRIEVRTGRSVSSGPTFQVTWHILSSYTLPHLLSFLISLKVFCMSRNSIISIFMNVKRWCWIMTAVPRSRKVQEAHYASFHSTHLHRRHIIMF